jgi:superfamily I DNA/RNA helicase
MLVGDEKQSIVQFAGADPTLIKRFSEEYSAEKIQLTKNFRSSTAIAAVAEAVTADLGDRSPLQVVSAAAGHVEFAVSPSERDEGIATARWIESVVADGLPATALAPGEDGSIHPEEVAVLARTGAALRWTAEALEDLGIEYVLGSDPRNWMSSRLGQAVADLVAYRAGPGHPSAQAHLVASAQAPVEDLESSPVPGLAALLAVSDGDNPAQLFAALAAADDIGDAEPQWLDDKDVLQRTWAAFLDRTPQNERTYINLQLEIARSQRGEPNAPGVRLLTVHKSQGREFRAVALVGMNDGQFPDFRQTTEKERRAELHCFYVAVTRASRVLRLSRARQRSGRNGLWDTRESEYLALARSAAK